MRNEFDEIVKGIFRQMDNSDENGNDIWNTPRILKEEKLLEKEMIKIIESGNAASVLKPNSEEPVMVGGHAMYVRNILDSVLKIQIWEWEGDITFFDDKTKSLRSENIYGNYEEKLKIATENVKGQMKVIQDEVNAKTIQHKTNSEIINEVLQSTNHGHIAGVGRVLPGAGSSSESSQLSPGYCTREQFEYLQRQHALEREEQRKSFESQQNAFKQFVDFFNRQQGTPSSQFQVPELYTPQVFLGSSYTPRGPSFTPPAPSTTPIGLDNFYTPTFHPRASRIVSGEQDDNGGDKDGDGSDGNSEYNDGNSEFHDVNDDK